MHGHRDADWSLPSDARFAPSTHTYPPPYHPPNHLRRTTQVLASSDAMTAGDFSNTENAAYQAGGRLVFAVAISVLYGNFDIPEQCFNLLCAVTVLWLL